MFKFLMAAVVLLIAASFSFAAERAALVREAVIYLSPDNTSNKLGNAERGRELILLDRTKGWLHVEALLGRQHAPDPAFEEDDEENVKTITGWVVDTGVVWASTPNGDRILFGVAADCEEEASRRHGRRGADQEALRLYQRVYDLFPNSPLAAESLYRAADIRWQVDKADVLTRPSARENNAALRGTMNEEPMKRVMKKFSGTRWADLAAFHLIDNKLCGTWEGSKCPEKEAEVYEKYAKEHPQSPVTPEALYQAASRRAALIDIYKTEEQPKKMEESKNRAIALAQQLASQFPQSDWSARGQALLFLVQQGVSTYGNAVQ